MRKIGLGLLLVLLFSCSSKQEWTIAGDQSGHVYYTLTTEKFINLYFLDVAEGLTGESLEPADFQVFSPQEIRSKLQVLPGVSQVEITESPTGFLNVSFAYANLRELLESQDENFPLNYVEAGGVATVSFYIDRSNFSSFLNMLVLPEDDLLSSFFPTEDNPITRDEYLELLTMLFEEYEDPSVIESRVNKLTVDFVFNCPRPIQEISGGTAKGSRAYIQIPLLDLLTLEEPVLFSFSF